jgi:hypothetical protein
VNNKQAQANMDKALPVEIYTPDLAQKVRSLWYSSLGHYIQTVPLLSSEKNYTFVLYPTFRRYNAVNILPGLRRALELPLVGVVQGSAGVVRMLFVADINPKKKNGSTSWSFLIPG